METPDARDLVDRIQDEWAQAYPDLDVGPIGILGRIHHIATAGSHRLDRDLEPLGVSRSEYDVLSALARGDRPQRASEVGSTTMLSGASITKITDTLSHRGLLERRRSERDGRVVLLEVTDAGRRVVEAELPRRLADDERALSGLTPAERDALAALLKKVSRAVGG